MQNQNSRSSRSASQIHLSTEQKTIFVNNYSNVRVVRSITRFDGARLSYALVRSNCNKLVITWPLGRLADLSPSGASSPRVINQQAPSWPCYNYYLKVYLCKCSILIKIHNILLRCSSCTCSRVDSFTIRCDTLPPLMLSAVTVNRVPTCTVCIQHSGIPTQYLWAH